MIFGDPKCDDDQQIRDIQNQCHWKKINRIDNNQIVPNHMRNEREEKYQVSHCLRVCVCLWTKQLKELNHSSKLCSENQANRMPHQNTKMNANEWASEQITYIRID